MKTQLSLRSCVVRLTVICLLGCAMQARGSVVINEIRPWHGTAGEATVSFPSWIELYNTDNFDVSLSGWTVLASRADGSVLAFSFPAISLPARCYLNLLLTESTPELDFTDSVGTLGLGPDSVGFAEKSGEAGLFYPGGIIADFVNWGFVTSSFGAAYTEAVTAGQWPPGGFINLSDFEGFSTIARLPSGNDNNTISDWKEVLRSYVASSKTHNPLQVEPGDGRGVDSTVVVFRWRQLSGATAYHVQVDNNPDFSSFTSALVFFDTSVTMTLSDKMYYWRVVPNIPGNSPAAVWRFAKSSSAARTDALIYCPQFWQHKDSRMLCIYNNSSEDRDENGVTIRAEMLSRGGCLPYTTTSPASGIWDNSHPTESLFGGRAHITQCPHCNRYCWRAACQMINFRYGGSLTQDEISYCLYYDWYTNGPEGDLGHHRGAYPDLELRAYRWAMMDAAITQHFPANNAPIPWNEIVTEITNDRPILFCGDGHSRVLNGFREYIDEDDSTRREIHTVDPWPGNTGWWVHSTVACAHYYKLPEGALAGRDTDPNVALDNDGDGVVNFDEGITTHTGIPPRDFCSDPNIVDTDKDELPDKTDIFVYTFCDLVGDCPENDPVTFADVDYDTKRGECDCDADNDADFDGGEEITGDGWNPLDPWETCAYDALQNEMAVHVLLLPAGQFCRENAFLYGGTFHETSEYHYEIVFGCPDPDSGEAIIWAGAITSTLEGRLPLTFIGTYPTGLYRARVDVLKDHLYSEPSNWDPWVCFQVPKHLRMVVPPWIPPWIPPFYESALATLGIAYDVTYIPPGSDGPTSAELGEYFVTLWLTGDGGFDALRPGQASNLMSYLDNGGKLWLTGMNIGEWIYANGIPDPQLDQFYTQYLGTQYVSPNAVCDRWSGVAGDFLSEFANVPITGADGANYDSHSPDEVLPGPDGISAGAWIQEDCHPLPGTLAAVGRADDVLNSRSVYMPFAWESIPDSLLREQIMSATIDWLYGTQLAPPPVTELTIQATAAGKQLHWSPVPGAMTYSIYSSDVLNFPLDLTTQIGGSEQPLFDIPSGGGAKGFYVVTAHSGTSAGGGESLWLEDISGQININQIVDDLIRRHIPYRIADGTSAATEMRKRAKAAP